MEQVVLKKGELGMLFGVFDGHSGSQVSRYLKHNFAKTFQKMDELKQGRYQEALENCFM